MQMLPQDYNGGEGPPLAAFHIRPFASRGEDDSTVGPDDAIKKPALKPMLYNTTPRVLQGFSRETFRRNMERRGKASVRDDLNRSRRKEAND
jgi:hypothetical protein